MVDIHRYVPLRSMLSGALALALVSVLAACATDAADPDPDEPPTVEVESTDTFVAAVDDDTYFGVIAADLATDDDERAFIAYLCDGDTRSTWFIDAASGDVVTLASDDAEVELTFHPDHVDGELTLAGGAPRAFTAERATGDAGLYRAEATVDAADYVGGWIILNDLSQRGAITLSTDGSVVDNPHLDPETRVAETSIGTLSLDDCITICVPVGRTVICTCIPFPHLR